jgi:AcrR family transcriptional regulator
VIAVAVVARPHFQNLPVERRDEILGLAAREFARSGFHATSYNQLLERLKLAKSSAYYYFDDKRDLFCTVIRRCYERYFEALSELESPRTARSFWKFFETAAELGFEYLVADPTAAGMMLCLHRESAGRELLTGDLLATIDAAYDRIIRDGQRLGAVRTDLPHRLLLEMVRNASVTFDLWFFDEQEDGKRPPSAKEAAALFVDVVRRMIRK